MDAKKNGLLLLLGKGKGMEGEGDDDGSDEESPESSEGARAACDEFMQAMRDDDDDSAFKHLTAFVKLVSRKADDDSEQDERDEM